MLQASAGNLIHADVEALVNTVNTAGVMGKGLALQFKQAYPAMFRAYEAACKAREVQLGQVHIFDLGGLVGGPRWIINFPTKGHWKSKSRIEDIAKGLRDLTAKVRELGICSIAVPPLGCGYGGLDWADVEPLIIDAFHDLPEVDVKLYPPAGTSTMQIRTDRPAMTPGRAALISIIKRYQQGMFDPFITLLEVHKLMYFLQESGQKLNLQYEAGEYGPYAKNLRQVLIRLDGHFLQGYGAGADDLNKPLKLKEGAVEAAEATFGVDLALTAHVNQVSALIEGFEDPYGLELLSSVHWVMHHDDAAAESADAAIATVQAWNPRKKKILKPEHLRSAWDHLMVFNVQSDLQQA